jgi:3-oxoacyl-[acyl-carrier protein] reductase
MDLGLRGRTALVCGASGGLGLASAQALAEEGANAVMVARRRDVLEREAARLGATAVPGDIRDPADLERAVDTALGAYGGLDIVVANGGGPPPGPAASIDATQAQAAVELLLLPVVRLVNLALPHLRHSKQARIVLIASISVREPIRNLALSNAVRPGVVGYMKTLATELAPEGITVNSIAPGRIATARTAALYGGEAPPEEVAAVPAGRFGEPREVGDVVAFLCSSRASYLTGTLVPVDGGLSHGLF